MARLSFKAIIVGGVTDIVATNLLNIPVVAYVKRQLHSAKRSGVSVTDAVERAIHANVGLHGLETIIGLACSVLGGYVAARIAKRDMMLNAALASWLCVGIGIYSLVTGRPSESRYLTCAVIAVTPVCYVAGARLCREFLVSAF